MTDLEQQSLNAAYDRQFAVLVDALLTAAILADDGTEVEQAGFDQAAKRFGMGLGILRKWHAIVEKTLNTGAT